MYCSATAKALEAGEEEKKSLKAGEDDKKTTLSHTDSVELNRSSSQQASLAGPSYELHSRGEAVVEIDTPSNEDTHSKAGVVIITMC